MALAQFILDNMEAVLNEWEQFAASIPSARNMGAKQLRNDAERILCTIAREMGDKQSGEEQQRKSQGHKVRSNDDVETAAETHGAVRFGEGFTLSEMVSEYRALRASVIRLWIAKQGGGASGQGLYELTRFNEGIDEALAHSVARFSAQLDQSRELFLGILGHDLRTPLQVILQAVEYVRAPTARQDRLQQAADHIEGGATRISEMVRDLLDVTRTRLGGQIPLEPAQMDLGELCGAVCQQFRLLHPDRTLKYEASGDLKGVWDEARCYQLLSNVLRNAFQHGEVGSTVTLAASGETDFVSIRVHNSGNPIPEDLLPRIFDPLARTERRDNTGSLGLGLYIACTIATAHGGTISVKSSRDQGTLFTICLPRKAKSGDAT